MLDINTINSALILKGSTMEPNMVNEKENDEKGSSEKLDWDCKVERKLFYAMRGLKPVGVNRHFMMVCIHKRFSSVLEKEISSKVIWDHLDSLYDMAALHESEILPFPNEETDFDLPSYYHDLVKEQSNASLSDADDDSRDSKSELNYRSSKKSTAAKSKQNGTPASNSKTTFATPVSGKSAKQSLKKNETKPSSTPDNKIKQESPLPAKLGKVKRSSSPFTSSRSSKSDQSSVKEDTPEPPATKKLKTDTSTPLSAKKTPKPESNSASKKPVRQEQNAAAKPNRTETPASSSKKLKSERDSSAKRSKPSTPIDNTPAKKGAKMESRRGDHESSRRGSDIPMTKSKSERASSVSSKGSRHEDSDSSVLSGSRKSSPAVRGDDRKKKKGSPMKRRRT